MPESSTVTSLFPVVPVSPPLVQRAERIRDLVGVARGCIIEIGRELIAASEEVPRGEWGQWLDREFGWSDETAKNYMKVAHVFQGQTLWYDSAGITIDATALYALAAPGVPQEARDEAIDRAQAGDHITLKAAEEMTARALAQKVFEMEEQFRSILQEAQAAKDKEQTEAVRALTENHFAKVREFQATIDGLQRDLAEQSPTEEQQAAIAKAIAEATAGIAAENQTLQTEIATITEEAKKADLEAIEQVLCRHMNIDHLSDKHWRLVAQIRGKGISVGKKTFLPITPAQALENEDNLRRASAVTEAIQALAGATPPGILLAGCYPTQRAIISERLDVVVAWVDACRVALEQYEDDGKGGLKHAEREDGKTTEGPAS